MFDFQNFASDFSIEIAIEGHHHCHQGWLQTHCPFCANGSGYHLGFHLKIGIFNCWRCGRHSLWDVISSLLHTQNRSEVYQVLNRYETRFGRAIDYKEIVRPKEVNLPVGTTNLHKAHKRYLQERGFDPYKIQDLWDIKATCGSRGLWSWRIIIPIRDETGRMVSYLGRAIGKVKPKYKMLDNEKMLTDPKALLYGIDQARMSKVVIVEGPTDVWRLGPGSVATVGINWHREQITILRKFRTRYIMYDNDRVAQKRARELALFLSNYRGHTEIISGLRTDPGDLSERKAEHIMIELGLR